MASRLSCLSLATIPMSPVFNFSVPPSYYYQVVMVLNPNTPQQQILKDGIQSFIMQATSTTVVTDEPTDVDNPAGGALLHGHTQYASGTNYNW